MSLTDSLIQDSTFHGQEGKLCLFLRQHLINSCLIMGELISAEEVAKHNTVENGLYIIIDNAVYEMAGFVDEHPGGAKILKRVGGKDASKQFWKVSPERVFDHVVERMRFADVFAACSIIMRVC